MRGQTPAEQVRVEEQIQGYLFTWPNGISIRANRLQSHQSDGRVTGELLIQAVNEQGKTINILPPTTFNFSAVRTRKELSNGLTAKYTNYPWEEMLAQLCFGVQDRVRRGEPVLELWTSQEVAPPECLLEPVLYKGLPTAIFGEKAVAKSTTALLFYFCLVLPWRENPLELKVPEQSTPTLILDWETEADIVHYYAKRIQEGHGLPALPILYRRCGLPLADDLEQIQHHATQSKAEVLIIDSLGAAAGGELNKPEIALRFFSSLRQLKKTTLLIAQTSKDDEAKRKTIYGSTYFTYYCRNIFELCRAQSLSEDEVKLALFHRWANISKLSKPISFSLHYNNTGLTAERHPFDIAEFMAKVTKTQAILEQLKRGPLKPKEIAQAVGASENSARVLLSRLKKQGQVTQIGDGWGLTSGDIF